MKRYFKRQWDETSGEDLTDAWGTSIFYFETDEQLNVLRQIQVFEKGQVLTYSTDDMDDAFGMLCDQQLEEEFEGFCITETEFINAWGTLSKRTK
jgi:hypothetical protein